MGKTINMSTLFLQFYNKRKTSVNRKLISYNNGFSETWDLCKKHGDFYWLEYKVEDDYLTDIDYFYDTELPISKGIVYVSCFYITQLWWVVILARKYPDIKFIVGGPVNGFIAESPLPVNLEISKKTVEETFGVEPYSYKWKLELPVIPTDGSFIHFTYPIDDKCYWSKCIFCTYPSDVYRKRVCPGYEFDGIYPDIKKHIFMYSPSISPDYLKVLKNQPDREDIEYVYFIRADVTDTLEESLKGLNRTDNYIFACGIDFTSDRMLSYINKGLTKQKYITLARSLAKFDCTLLFTVILGWPNLIESDIQETSDFVDELKSVNPKVIWKINKLMSKPEKTLNLEIGNKYRIGDFYCGFYPLINSKQKHLNSRVLKEIQRFGNVNDFYSNMTRKAL